MKKVILNSILISITVITITYLVSCFIAWEINPSMWAIEGRFAAICTALFSSSLFVAFYLDEKKNNRNKS